MKKKIFIAVIIVLVILSSIFAYKKYSYYEEKQDYKRADKTVQNFIKAIDDKDMKKANSYILDSKETDFHTKLEQDYIDKIISIKYIKSRKTKATINSETYTMYNGKKKKFDKTLLLDVDFNIIYIDDNQPEPNGLNSYFIYLVKDDNGDFKIVSMGSGP